VYDPAGSAWLSALVAAAPIIVLLGLLAMGLSAPRAAAAGLIAALAAAMGVFRMPADAALAAAVYGACYGLLPIGWIVLGGVFFYHLTVRSGQFEVIKQSVAAISPDRRIQALLIAFCFGTFLEGAAGFGAPVAITAALLIGLGFRPRIAAGLALVANTCPVAFGSLGIPIFVLARSSGLDSFALGQMAGRQLTPFSLLVPVLMVAMLAGWKGLSGCWPAILVCGGSFAVVQYGMSNYHGPTLVGVLGGAVSLVTLTVFLRFWQPKQIWRWADDEPQDERPPAEARQSGALPAGPASPPLTAKRIVYAWMPWVLLSAMIFLWGLPQWKAVLEGRSSPLVARIGKLSWEVPRLHRAVYRTRPVVPVAAGADRAANPESAVFDLDWLGATGTAIFVAAVGSAVWLRIGVAGFFCQLAETVYCLRWALATIACTLALAFLTKYSGMDATLGLALTHTGPLYPFFAPLLGWLGVALTGSDTSANALFGSLQRITAEQLGFNPLLLVASNSTGGVMGKMISAQSIVVAAAATRQTGSEGSILRFVFFHSVILACLMGLLTCLEAYVLPGTIPR
jgi:lactate permease